MNLNKGVRKVHRYAFGYLKPVSYISVCVFVLIALTGILLIHKNDLNLMQTARISADLLPEKYTIRLKENREADGLPLEENPQIPLSWIVYDLHSGEFFGTVGKLIYDLMALSIAILALTGVYLFWLTTKKRKI